MKMQIQEFEIIKLINRKPMKNLQEEKVFVIKKTSVKNMQRS